MTQSKEEYRGHYARLAKEFANLPRVATPSGLGQLQILDLRQDCGYGAGVMLDEFKGRAFAYIEFQAHDVRLLSEYREQLMQLVTRGATSDGNVISKSQRTELCRLGLAERVAGGWTIPTAAGVAEAEKAGWLRH